MWDLSSLTRDRTRVPCVGRRILNHWTTREIPGCILNVGLLRFPYRLDVAADLRKKGVGGVFVCLFVSPNPNPQQPAGGRCHLLPWGSPGRSRRGGGLSSERCRPDICVRAMGLGQRLRPGDISLERTSLRLEELRKANVNRGERGMEWVRGHLCGEAQVLPQISSEIQVKYPRAVG